MGVGVDGGQDEPIPLSSSPLGVTPVGDGFPVECPRQKKAREQNWLIPVAKPFNLTPDRPSIHEIEPQPRNHNCNALSDVQPCLMRHTIFLATDFVGAPSRRAHSIAQSRRPSHSMMKFVLLFCCCWDLVAQRQFPGSYPRSLSLLSSVRFGLGLIPISARKFSNPSSQRSHTAIPLPP